VNNEGASMFASALLTKWPRNDNGGTAYNLRIFEPLCERR
jgi:hypothetical protein